jgi:hypothetical protein
LVQVVSPVIEVHRRIKYKPKASLAGCHAALFWPCTNVQIRAVDSGHSSLGEGMDPTFRSVIECVKRSKPRICVAWWKYSYCQPFPQREGKGMGVA